MDRKIDVLIVEPGKEPQLSTVVDDLEHLQQIVGGPIEAGCYLPQLFQTPLLPHDQSGDAWTPQHPQKYARCT